MDPTSVKEPVAAAAVEFKATAMNAAANHPIVGATIGRLDRWMGANGIRVIDAVLYSAVRSDNGTSVPLRIRG
jgi:prephenate dehydrogenase